MGKIKLVWVGPIFKHKKFSARNFLNFSLKIENCLNNSENCCRHSRGLATKRLQILYKTDEIESFLLF